ncbi:MAG: wcaJ [Collimonas fungivorans]|uniref:undecaprenyl-phosphate glucose phosphotransferase n=1 Tax=Collimonas fungivorans TaxID=158899 RepID=UPI0026EA1516|nr:undecaprenyl-phosphate glucose phosphotransferase [Collimonas fungivorans]MDB5766125.1 wcaJ [Collimonas fungivorans]
MSHSTHLTFLQYVLGQELPRRIADTAILAIAANAVAYYVFHASLSDAAPVHMVLLYFCCVLAFMLFAQLDLYIAWPERPASATFIRLAASWALVLILGIFMSRMVHGIGRISHHWLLYWYLTSMVLLLLYRFVSHVALTRMHKQGFNFKRVIIVGYGETGQEMHRRALQQPWIGYEVHAVVGSAEQTENLQDANIARINKLEDIHAYVSANQIDEIWITLPMSAAAQLRPLQIHLRNTLVDIRWVPDTMAIQMISRRMTNFLGTPTVELNRPAPSGARGICKHLLDKLFALVALTALTPLFVAIGVAIKISSPGPVFFKQVRLGLNGKKFMIYKFRSMKLHQEHNKVTQATQGDPRITRIGQFLRRTSLDELPQFINVLLGDMSVIGPRPHAMQHNQMYEELLDLYMVRHRVKPGITGWAQIHGHRGETDTLEKMETRVQFDLHYIQNWSFLMDFRILLWTAFKGWSGKTAY